MPMPTCSTSSTPPARRAFVLRCTRRCRRRPPKSAAEIVFGSYEREHVNTSLMMHGQKLAVRIEGSQGAPRVEASFPPGPPTAPIEVSMELRRAQSEYVATVHVVGLGSQTVKTAEPDGAPPTGGTIRCGINCRCSRREMGERMQWSTTWPSRSATREGRRRSASAREIAAETSCWSARRKSRRCWKRVRCPRYSHEESHMKDGVREHLLKRLDHHRLCLAEPGSVVREFSPDRSECRILLAPTTAAGIATLVAKETALADRHGYTLEWKVYGHDRPANLVDSLLAAGFEPDDEELVLVLPLAIVGGAPAGAGAFPPGTDIVRVQDERGLADVAEISRDSGRRNVEAETRRLAAILRDAPDAMSVHLLRFDGEPVACGRTHYAEGSELAELAGGRTKSAHRRRGYFSALVRHRLAEASARGRTHAVVDALPTSEPILRRLGFTNLTSTRPYVYVPAGGAP